MLLHSLNGVIAAGASPVTTTPTAHAAGGYMGVAAGDVRIPVLLQVEDADTPPSGFQVTAVGQGSAGIFAVTNGGRLVTFSPNGAPTGSYTGSYTVSDGLGNLDTEIVTVLVTDAAEVLFADGTSWNDGQAWID